MQHSESHKRTRYAKHVLVEKRDKRVGEGDAHERGAAMIVRARKGAGNTRYAEEENQHYAVCYAPLMTAHPLKAKACECVAKTEEIPTA